MTIIVCPVVTISPVIDFHAGSRVDEIEFTST
jgi:hypothetical protein